MLLGPVEGCPVGIVGEVVGADGVGEPRGERSGVGDDVVPGQLEGPEAARGDVQPELTPG
jgi:hypothetical protein